MSAYLGRYHRVRALNQRGYGPPLVLDRKWRRLTPYHNEEWWRHPSGVLLPVLQGGIGVSGMLNASCPYIGYPQSADPVSALTFALDSAYSAGNNDCILFRQQLAQAKTLTAAYFNIASYTGTAANVNDLDCEIRTNSGTTPVLTGGGLLSSGTVNPASATGWISVTGLNASLLSGENYWIILGDGDGNGTDFATLNVGLTRVADILSTTAGLFSYTSTNGGTSVTSQSRHGPCVLVFSDGTVKGQPFVNNGSSSNTTNKKGLYLDGLSEPLRLFGFVHYKNLDSLSGGQIFWGNDLPSATPFASSIAKVFESTTTAAGVYFAPVKLERRTPYRLVWTFSSASTACLQLTIGTGADANLRKAMIGGGLWYWTESNGTTNWSNDNISAQPVFSLLIEDFMPRARLHSIT
jgi:hypothetical protein